MSWTFDGVVEYSCLGDWFVGKDHFFAVANTKESRKDEKYRCFLKNRDDDYFLGISITPECNTIKTVEKAPERMRLKPVRSKLVEPTCLLPENFTGEWINTANIDADVFINSTHIVETWHPDDSRWRKAIYVCKEQRDSRYMMARLTIDGCQVDYQCFDFMPRHHNIIRSRKGVAMIKNDFHTVCSWVQFKNEVEWKYDLWLSKFSSKKCVAISIFALVSFQKRIRFLYVVQWPAHLISHRPGTFYSRLEFLEASPRILDTMFGVERGNFPVSRIFPEWLFAILTKKKSQSMKLTVGLLIIWDVPSIFTVIRTTGKNLVMNTKSGLCIHYVCIEF